MMGFAFEPFVVKLYSSVKHQELIFLEAVVELVLWQTFVKGLFEELLVMECFVILEGHWLFL